MPSVGCAEQSVAHSVKEKERIELGITSPEPARLLPEAVSPRDAEPLHPSGRVSALSGQEHESIPHREENAAGVTLQIVDDPAFLPFATERDPDEIGFRIGYDTREFGFILLRPS